MERYGIYLKGEKFSPYYAFVGTRAEAEAELLRIEHDDPKYAGKLEVRVKEAVSSGRFGKL